MLPSLPSRLPILPSLTLFDSFVIHPLDVNHPSIDVYLLVRVVAMAFESALDISVIRDINVQGAIVGVNDSSACYWCLLDGIMVHGINPD